MTELQGSLQDFGLATLVRFLGDQGHSGRLTISQGGWAGEIDFDHGRPVAASIGEERGTAALELIVMALADGDFVYTDGAPVGARNIDASPAQVQADLERLLSRPKHRGGMAPVLRSIPRIADLTPDVLDQEVVVTLSDLELLFEVDGQRNIEQIVVGRNPVGVLHALTRLSEVGVIKLDPPDEWRGPPPSHSASNGAVRVAGSMADGEVIAATATSAGAPPENAQRGPPRTEPPSTQKSTPRRSWVGDAVRTIILTGVFLLGFRLVLQSVHVEGQSMLPGLSEGQLLLINRAAYFHVEGSDLEPLIPASQLGSLRFPFGGPRRGDVMVFQSPTPPYSELVKRVVGLPGEALRIERGQVFVDDRLLDEPYTAGSAAGIDTYPADGNRLRIPDDSFFVLGDNRQISLDSRLGWFVRADDLIGRAWLTYWPPSQWGPVPHAIVAEIQRPVAAPAPGSAATTAAIRVVTPTVASTLLPTPQPTLAATAAVTISPTAQLSQPQARVLLTGSPADQAGWPSDPQSVAWFDAHQYRIVPRQPTRFVALTAPIGTSAKDVLVRATFHKTGGPPGGGYGIIVRDSVVAPRDGLSQGGRFYVAEVGDRGEVGIWRREEDHWVDLLPWTVSSAVHVGGTTNDLQLQAEGNRLTYLVNGVQVTSIDDGALSAGRVGVFVGGDLNEVVLDRFSLEVLGEAPAQ